MKTTYYIIIKDGKKLKTDHYGKALNAKKGGAEIIEIQTVTMTTNRSVVTTKILTYL